MTTGTKPVLIKPEEYGENRVPTHMIKAVMVLNQALEIDSGLIQQLLDNELWLHKLNKDQFLAHPCIIVRDDGKPALSAFGLLAGAINQEPFRICVDIDDEGSGEWVRFGIMRY